MTETSNPIPDTAPAAKKRAGGLNGMLLPELKQLAGGLGIKGVGGMRKSQLIDAIRAAQGGQQGGSRGDAAAPEAKADRPAEQREQRQPRAKRDDKPADEPSAKQAEKSAACPRSRPEK